MGLMQVVQSFSSFFLNFLPYLMILHGGCCGTLKILQIWQNKLGVNEENPCSNCAQRIFRALDPPLILTQLSN